MPLSDLQKMAFMAAFDEVQAEIHDVARSKGFWDKERNVGEIFMLFVTELAEGFEDFRKGKEASDHIPQFNPLEEELADTIIRIMDFAEARKLRVAAALLAKIEFNKTRERLHGKNF